MSILLFLTICCTVLVCLIAYNQKTKENFYRRMNLKNESDWKCGPCVTYGSLFDYKKQKSDRTFGVANGCQKIF